jgi:hypothetical protein
MINQNPTEQKSAIFALGELVCLVSALVLLRRNARVLTCLPLLITS